MRLAGRVSSSKRQTSEASRQGGKGRRRGMEVVVDVEVAAAASGSGGPGRRRGRDGTGNHPPTPINANAYQHPPTHLPSVACTVVGQPAGLGLGAPTLASPLASPFCRPRGAPGGPRVLPTLYQYGRLTEWSPLPQGLSPPILPIDARPSVSQSAQALARDFSNRRAPAGT